MAAIDAVRVLHILFAAAWLGAGLTFSGDIRRTLELGPPHTTALVDRLRRVFPMMLGSAMLTILSGFGLIALAGGMSKMSGAMLVGMGLAVVMLLILAGLILPIWTRIAAIIGSGGNLDEARPLARRLAMLNGIEHGLWLAVLITMVVRQ